MMNYERNIIELLPGDTPRDKYSFLKELLLNPKPKIETISDEEINKIAINALKNDSMIKDMLKIHAISFSKWLRNLAHLGSYSDEFLYQKFEIFLSDQEREVKE